MRSRDRVRARTVAVGLGLACVALGDDAAWADDVLAPETTFAPQSYVNFFQEVRVGAYAHNVIHDEDAPVDVSVETLSSPIVFANVNNPWVSWFFDPRINLGAMINTGGKTSYAFTGLTWRIPLWGPVFFEGEFGGSVNNAPTHPEPNRIDMGCVPNFRESGGFGVQLSKNVDFIVNVEHTSHATFCTHIDPGITDFGFRVGYKF
jgi:lipid A 3-O-deacylase